MWLRFSVDWDWKPRPQVTIAFKAGGVHNVTRACAEAAIAASKATPTERPARNDSRKSAIQAALSEARTK
ncbi:hypothetical protein ACVIKO_001138 [Rhizobium ruizarguesonis]